MGWYIIIIVVPMADHYMLQMLIVFVGVYRA